MKKRKLGNAEGSFDEWWAEEQKTPGHKELLDKVSKEVDKEIEEWQKKKKRNQRKKQ